MKKLFVNCVAFIARLFKFKATTPKQPQTLEEALAQGYVQIEHPKVKGGVAKHIATRNPTLIPAESAPKGTGKATTDTLAYFAWDVQGWRSLSTMPRILADTTWTYLGKSI